MKNSNPETGPTAEAASSQETAQINAAKDHLDRTAARLIQLHPLTTQYYNEPTGQNRFTLSNPHTGDSLEMCINRGGTRSFQFRRAFQQDGAQHNLRSRWGTHENKLTTLYGQQTTASEPTAHELLALCDNIRFLFAVPEVARKDPSLWRLGLTALRRSLRLGRR